MPDFESRFVRLSVVFARIIVKFATTDPIPPHLAQHKPQAPAGTTTGFPPETPTYNVNQTGNSRAMGIRFTCPNGHKLNVKEFLAGKRGVCPSCGAKFVIPEASEPDGEPTTASSAPVGPAAAGFPMGATTPSPADVGSVSVVIPVVEPQVPSAPSPDAPDPPSTTTSTSDATPAFDFAPTSAAATPPPVSNYAIRRARSRRLQMQIAVMLLLAVIVLAIVLFWVLRRGPTETTAALRGPSHLAHGAERAYVAEAITCTS